MTSVVSASKASSMYPDSRIQMSRTHERLAIRRNLGAVVSERERQLGSERFVDPFEVEASADTELEHQRVENL